LGKLGSERAWVVHGVDGIDELTTTGLSYVAELDNGKIRTFEVVPGDAGLPVAQPADLKGGDGAINAAAMRRMLNGEPGAFRDAVVYNAAAALIVAGNAESLAQGATLAAAAIDDGRAEATLNKLVAITNDVPSPAIEQ
jgi:anthranilate phosphoribosyltransferase